MIKRLHNSNLSIPIDLIQQKLPPDLEEQLLNEKQLDITQMMSIHKI